MATLKELRRFAGLSREELASELGVSDRTVEAWEQGLRDVRKASGQRIKDLAKALGCSVDEILRTEKEKKA